jgi:DNA-binding FrmR family transcriptional regulator
MKTNEHRINNIIGQLQAFKKSLNLLDYDCYQKLIQLKAISRAFNSLSEKIIHEELNNCLNLNLKQKDKEKLDIIIKELINK